MCDKYMPPESVKGADFDKKTASAALVGGVGIGGSYSLCFGGGEAYCQLSSIVFTLLALFFAVFILKSFGRIKNGKALALCVPAILISCFNCIFSLSVMNYINMLTVYALIMVMCAAAQAEKSDDGAVNIRETMGILLCRPVDAILEIKKGMNSESNTEEKGGVFSAGLSRVILKAAVGIAVSIPLIVIIGVLLCSADKVFSALIVNMLSGFDFIDLLVKIIVFLIVFCYASGCIYSIRLRSRVKAGKGKKGDVIILNSFLFMLNIMFALFCYVQIAYVFCGGFMTLPDGVVYSEYAREGFFQLLFVTVINFGCILFIVSVFRESSRTRWLKIQLTALCLFTGVLIASSFYRMSLYIGTYGYTELRNRVLCFLAMESALIIYTVYAVLRQTRLYKLAGFYFGIFVVGVIGVNLLASPFAAGCLNERRLIKGEEGSFVSSYDSVFVYDRICRSVNASPEARQKALEVIYYYKDNAGDYKSKRWQNFKAVDVVNERIFEKYQTGADSRLSLSIKSNTTKNMNF